MKRILALGIVMIMVLSVPAHGTEPPLALEEHQTTVDENKIENFELTLSVEEAVTYGLAHNLDLKTLENKVATANLMVTNARMTSSDLIDARNTIEDAEVLLSVKKTALLEGEESLEDAKEALEAGIAPFDIPVLEGVFTIEAGTNIEEAVTALVYSQYIDLTEEEKRGMIATYVSSITAKVTSGIESSEEELAEGQIAISEAYAVLEGGRSSYESAIRDASRGIEDRLGYQSTIALEDDDIKKLMRTMADVNLSVTEYAEDIYRNQIAMLIRKNYYDALYAGKILSIKAIALERGNRQYEMAHLAYENGMKALNDDLLAKMYRDGTEIAYRLAQAEYKNALCTLKNTMNMDQSWELTLSDTLDVEITEENLSEGLATGTVGRIEIQESLANKMLCELNEDLIKDMNLPARETYKETEASLLTDQAEVTLEQNQMLVETEIRQSYELMMATADMLDMSEALIADAQEVVDIAELKYEQGMGAESSLLTSMNLESSSGTIVEYIAAQENLATIEAQVAQVKYSYIMARCKYYNDSAMLFD